jgi:uncharacterized SAM-binding protein YcdF (DUF218 family)
MSAKEKQERPPRGRRRIWLWLLVGVLLVFAAVAYVPLSIWIFSFQDQTRKADAAIVLGAAAYGMQPSPVFRERIRHAVQLYKDDIVQKIVFTGGAGGPGDQPEAVIGRRWAMKQGVLAEDILMEKSSSRTYENLLYAKPVLQEAKINTVLLVSDPLHMKRAMLMADALGITAYSSPTRTSLFKTRATKLPFLIKEAKDYASFRARLLVGQLPAPVNAPAK